MFDEMPIDWLMDYWRKIKDENQGSLRLPPASLFQHIGDQSSLKEKGLSGREQREPFFDQYDQKYRGGNPPAIVTSSMSSKQGKPRDAYEKGSGYFWASHQRKGNYVLIKFNAPIAVKRCLLTQAAMKRVTVCFTMVIYKPVSCLPRVKPIHVNVLRV